MHNPKKSKAVVLESKTDRCVQYLPRRVPQRGNADCGLASLACVTGEVYEAAQMIFDELGYGQPRPRRQGYSTNFRELEAALRLARMKIRKGRWHDWASLPALSILKVRPWGGANSRDWHWVVAAREAESGLCVIDGAYPAPDMRLSTYGQSAAHLDAYCAYGSYIEIVSGSPFQFPDERVDFEEHPESDSIMSRNSSTPAQPECEAVTPISVKPGQSKSSYANKGVGCVSGATCWQIQ